MLPFAFSLRRVPVGLRARRLLVGLLPACAIGPACALLFVSPPAAAGPEAGGAWSEYHVFNYGEYAGALELSADGRTLWTASSVSAGGLNPATGYPNLITSLRSLNIADQTTTHHSSAGLGNAEQDNVFAGLVLTRDERPVLLHFTKELRPGRLEPDHSPYIFTHAPATDTWSPATLPAGEEQQWAGPPINIVRDDLGDLLLCGNHRVLISADGAVWTQRADLNTHFAPPPPHQPAYGAGGLPAWLPAPQLLTNQPLFQPYSPGWQTGLARMPWGELFCGGEQGSYFHSLDNGLTWHWFDPLVNQVLRDAQGRPLYRNPHAFRLSQTYHAEATGDGEVMLNCKNNLGHHFFVWTSTGQLVEASAGLPAGSDVVPGICTRFLTLPASGETYMCTRWTNQPTHEGAVPDTPTGRFNDLFRWDGAAWTLVEPPEDHECESPNALAADATGLLVPMRYVPFPLLHSIHRWTPDLSSAPPPRVSITGGDSATFAPAVTLSATTGRAVLQLEAAVSATNDFACQWSARGPGPVVFENARAVSPRAWFSVVGDYVLNLRATDLATGAHRGASVIVHVRPAPGGSAPLITTQPANTVIPASGSAAYSLTVVASGPGPFTYRWQRDGRDLIAPSARTATLTGIATPADLGATFHCVVGNPYGTVASHTAQLGHAPEIIAPPLPQTVPAGQNAVFGVAARGSGPLTWQWRLDGTPIPNATRAAFAAGAPGAYSVSVTNLFGTVTSAAATLANGTPAGPVAPLRLLAGAANAPSGGDAYLNDGTLVPAVYPLGQPIPLAVERAPYGGYGATFIRWEVAALAAGHTATFADPAAPQTSLTLSGPGQTTPVRVTAVYADASADALPGHALAVVNGRGTGEYRETWSHLANASAGAPLASVEALPAPPGLVFAGWIGDGSLAIADAGAALTTVTLPAARATLTATYAPAHAHWRAKNFGASADQPAVAGDLADPDGDGIPNLLEYACGLAPLSADSATARALLPRLAPGEAAAGGSGGASGLEFTFVRDLSASDLTYVVQVSTDLETWTDASRFSDLDGDTPDTAATLLVARVTDPLAGLETITVRETGALGTAARRFFRLRLTLE